MFVGRFLDNATSCNLGACILKTFHGTYMKTLLKSPAFFWYITKSESEHLETEDPVEE